MTLTPEDLDEIRAAAEAAEVNGAPFPGAKVIALLSELDRLHGLDHAVRVMRNHQRDFFAGDRSPEKLRASKIAERAVDKLLDPPAPTPPPPQGRLW